MYNFQEGQYTSYIYSLIKDQNYSEAIKILNIQLETNPRNRAALSLLGYCNYLIGNYGISAEMYEQLLKYYPEVTEYRIYHSQSLYKADLYDEAFRACNMIDKPDLVHDKSMLQFAIKYQKNELSDSNKVLNNAYADKPDTLVCQGCVLYREGKWEEAKNKFEESKKYEDSPYVEYNVGVCNYKMKLYTAAHTSIQNILDKAADTHPEIVLMENRIDPTGIRTNDNFTNTGL
jgi:tetratricopeptide repeat protein 30